jgi:transcriptional regulator with XRE-family HTH domain
MVIGQRLKDLCDLKKMSQGDVEKRTGLLRCYISRVENGHTVPSVDTLDKMARALEIPMYRLFTGDELVEKPNIPQQDIPSRAVITKQDREMQVFVKLLSRLSEKNLRLLFQMASKMANRA